MKRAVLWETLDFEIFFFLYLPLFAILQIFRLFNSISVESELRIPNFDARILAQKLDANWIMMMLITDLNYIM